MNRLLTVWFTRLRQASFAVAVLAMVVLVAWGLEALYVRLDRPVTTVQIEGELHYLTQEELQALVVPALDRGLLSLDLDQVRELVESHVWVAQASVNRNWPDQLNIAIEEEIPLARWGDSGFLNNRGQVLMLAANEQLSGLPTLAGDLSQSRLVMEQYQMLSRALASVDLRVAELVRSPRGAWSLQTQSGLALELGRDDQVERIKRFLTVWRKGLQRQANEIETVDLRYANGLAVSWKAGVAPLGDRAGARG